MGYHHLIVIGYFVAVTGSFASRLVYFGANTLLAVISYTLIAGPFERVQLTESEVSATPPLQTEMRS
jgi:hypothetical protein